MSNFAALIATIQANIKTNGNEEITGAVLQDVLEAMVDALGTEAINNLESALSDEETARQNADGTLQDNIDAETLRAGTAEAGLDNRLDTIEGEIPSAASSSNKLADKAYVDEADTALGNAIGAIEDAIENGYVYAGIATPSGTPASGKVFYLAVTAGTYTNYGALVVTQGINILKNNGTAWSQEQLICIDDVPAAGSDNLVKSGGVKETYIKSTRINDGRFNDFIYELYIPNATSDIYIQYAKKQIGGGTANNYIRFVDGNDTELFAIGAVATDSNIFKGTYNGKDCYAIVQYDDWVINTADKISLNLDKVTDLNSSPVIRGLIEEGKLNQRIDGIINKFAEDYYYSSQIREMYIPFADQNTTIGLGENSTYYYINIDHNGTTVSLLPTSGNPSLYYAKYQGEYCYILMKEGTFLLNKTNIGLTDAVKDLGYSPTIASLLKNNNVSYPVSQTHSVIGKILEMYIPFMREGVTHGYGIHNPNNPSDDYIQLFNSTGTEICTLQPIYAGSNIFSGSCNGQTAIAIIDNSFYWTVSPGQIIIDNVSSLDKCPRIRKLLQEHPLAGKVSYFIGDSITAGSVNAATMLGGWPTLLAKKEYLQSINKGIGGSKIMVVEGISNAICQRIQNITVKMDYLIIEGGFNDIVEPTSSIGTITSGYESSFDVNTLCGAMEYICKYVMTYYPYTKKGFVIPYRITPTTGWENWADLILQICEKWGLPCLDLRKVGGFNLESVTLQWLYGTYHGSATQYSESSGYSQNDAVTYGGSYYKAKVNIASPAGAFDNTKWTLSEGDGNYDDWHCNVLGYEILSPKVFEWMKTL